MAQHMTKNEMLKKAFASAVAFTTLACSVPFSPLNINSGALPTNSILANAEEDSVTFTKNVYYGLKLLDTNEAFADLEEGTSLFFAPSSLNFTPGANISSIPDGTAILEVEKEENYAYDEIVGYDPSSRYGYTFNEFCKVANMTSSELLALTKEQVKALIDENLTDFLNEELRNELGIPDDVDMNDDAALVEAAAKLFADMDSPLPSVSISEIKQELSEMYYYYINDGCSEEEALEAIISMLKENYGDAFDDADSVDEIAEIYVSKYAYFELVWKFSNYRDNYSEESMIDYMKDDYGYEYDTTKTLEENVEILLADFMYYNALADFGYYDYISSYDEEEALQYLIEEMEYTNYKYDTEKTFEENVRLYVSNYTYYNAFNEIYYGYYISNYSEEEAKQYIIEELGYYGYEYNNSKTLEENVEIFAQNFYLYVARSQIQYFREEYPGYISSEFMSAYLVFKEGGEAYTEDDICTYVHVKESGAGFDSCMWGALVRGGSSYFCYGGGVQDLRGSTFQCSNTVISVEATPDTVDGLIKDTEFTFDISCEDDSFNYTDYTLNKSKAVINGNTITVPLVLHGVEIGGDNIGDVTLDLTFDYIAPPHTYADQKDMDVVFSKDFSKATLTVTSDDGEFTNVVVLDSAIEGDNQVVSASDPICETSGKIERVCSTDCTEIGDVLYRATFVLNGDVIVYDKPFADGVYGDHKLKHYAATDNGCKTDGNEEYWKCETCGKLFSDAEAKTETSEEEVTIKQSHTWVENIDEKYKVSDTPDCECGYEYYCSCSVCGEASTETFFDETSAPGHLFKKRTFKWSSKTDYDECTMELPCQRDDCDFVLKYTAKEGEYQGVDAFGNTYTGSITSNVTSDCTKEGEITYYATFLVYDNGEGEEPSKYTAKIVNDFPALGHDLVYMEAKAATCTEKGNKAGYYCNTCHKGFADAECKEEIKDFTIPKLGHHTVKIDGVSATCTEDGIKACVKCETCNKYFTDSTCNTEINDITDPATGHKMYASKEEILAHTQFVWNKEELEKSYAVIKCDECGDAAAIICDYVDADIENVKDATCQQRGFDSYNAVFKNKEYNITVNGSLLINKDKVAHKYDENGVCESCGMHVADVSIEKDGDYISSGKLRVKYFANSVCNDENYEIVKTGVQYSTDFVNFKEGSKDKVSKYEANVADYGDGNAVIPFVIVKNKKDGTTFRIDGEQVNGYYTKPELQIVKNGDYISSGKNRVKFTISPTLLPEGYTIMKTGVYYNNDEGNATAEFDKDTWKTASKSDSKYEVNVLDKGYGVSLKGYAVIKRIDGSEFTIETDVMHGEYTRPEISIKSESVITADKKNRVKLSFNTEMPKEGYTVLESGICYVNNAANTIYTFDKAKAASFDANGAASAYVEVADNHYGITAQAYIKVADLSGNQFTFTTDIIHTTFKAPAN